MASKAPQNPLVPHVRMRALYRALVEVRMVSSRASKLLAPGDRIPKGLEGSWVAPAIDLQANDLLSLSGSPCLLRYIRSVGFRMKARAAVKSDVTRAFKPPSATRTHHPLPVERFLEALGMAEALKFVCPGTAVVAWVGNDELSASEWKRMLQLSLDAALPLVIVCLPSSGANKPVDLPAVVRSLRVNTIPVIPVDAGDTLALYRVSQEMLLRSRADGGIAMIDCIDCKTDPVAMLASQLVRKGICTSGWVASVETSFCATLARL
jgi:hypothetical protein